MQRTRLLIAAAVVGLAWPVSASAQSIECKDFNSNLEKLDKNWSNTGSFPGMELNLGFVMGAYFAATSQTLEKFDESGFVEFLKKLASGCSAEPRKHVMPMTLALLGKDSNGAKPSTTEDTLMDLLDLKLDIAKMSGKPVTVHGTITILGDMAMLGGGNFDSSPIPVELRKLSRSERKDLLKNCEMQCGLTITGVVGDVMLQKGIVANSITLD